MIQQDLLSWTPPQPFEARGKTFVADRDSKRLGEQCQRIFNVFRDGQKRTLAQVAAITGDPEASISARYRDLKRFGFKMDKEFVTRGLWLYWMVI